MTAFGTFSGNKAVWDLNSKLSEIENQLIFCLKQDVDKKFRLWVASSSPYPVDTACEACDFNFN